jgi:predicted metal-binding membrane protein
MLGGGLQFTALEDRCLDECRHPAVLLLSHYRRGAPAALKLGARHGLFCLGCCWALMLVMFVVGIANLAWMMPLTRLMLYEEIACGDRTALALVAVGALVAATPGWMPALVRGH